MKESEKGDNYPDLTEKTMEHESDSDTNCNQCTQYSHQRIDKQTGQTGNNSIKGEHPNYNIIKTDQNTEKSPGDLRRLAVTQTSVEDNRLTLV